MPLNNLRDWKYLPILTTLLMGADLFLYLMTIFWISTMRHVRRGYTMGNKTDKALPSWCG